MNWQNFKLKEITQRITKGTTPTSIGHSFQNEGVNYIKAESFNDSGRFINEKFAFITHECNSALKRSILNENDILFTIAGVLGRCTIVNKEILPANTNQAVAIIRLDRTKKILPEYVRYWLSQDIVRKKVNKEKIQSAQPNINLKQLGDLEIKVPCVDIQKQLILIIKTYDDLIENNLKRINLLEQAAQNIYEEWFVNMRFPGFESAEFDSATGLPVGWKKVNLYDIADIQMGYPFKAHQFNQEEKGNPVVRIRDIPKNFTETFTTESVSEKYRILNGDILIGMDGIFHIDAWSGQNDALLVQRVCRVKAYQSILHGYLLEALRAPISYFEQTISGATVAHLGAKHLKEIFVSIPSESTVTRLELFNKLLNQKVLLYKQNQKLKEARDILLPRLMNQTIEV